MTPSPPRLPAARPATVWAKLLGIGVLYPLLGPVVGGGLLALGLAVGELWGGNANTAGGMLLVGWFMLPLAYLSGVPTALACGVIAAWETRQRGRPGWVPPLLVAAAGAMVFVGRTEWMGGISVWLILCHLLAATACTALARVVARASEV